jgi:hypothetical protein
VQSSKLGTYIEIILKKVTEWNCEY